MSKVIKQMQMDALENTFGDVRDMIVLSISGLSNNADDTLRTELAKKNVRLHMVKNSFARLVFRDRLDMDIPDDSDLWDGPTFMAWGGESVGELSRVVDTELTEKSRAARYRKAVKVKGAIVDGRPMSFDLAKKIPTREEAIANVLGLALAPAMRLSAQITGPASQVAGQIKQHSEGNDE